MQLTSLASEYHLGGVVKLYKMLPDMRVTRLDIAIDYIGVNPLDLIVHYPKPGKRQVYFGNEGRPETIYFYAIKPLPAAGKKPKKSTGPFRFKIYERRAYCRQMGLPLPYGPAPVTRVEVTKRWNKPTCPTLLGLADLSSPFKGIRIAYAAAVGNYTKGWRKFCMERFAGGLSEHSQTPDEWRMRRKYEKCASELIYPSTWERWQEGLGATGLDNWMSLI